MAATAPSFPWASCNVVVTVRAFSAQGDEPMSRFYKP